MSTAHKNAHNDTNNMHEVIGFPNASNGYSNRKNIKGVSEWLRDARRQNSLDSLKGYVAATTEVDGDVYTIDAPELDINGIVFQSGTTVRFTFTSGYTSTLYSTSSYLQISGALLSDHNGVHIITTVNASYLEVTIAEVTDGTGDDAAGSPAVGYVTHQSYDPENLANGQTIPRQGQVIFDVDNDLWYGNAFVVGDEYYNVATLETEKFNGTDILPSIGYRVWTALITQTSTSAPTLTVIKNTLGFTPSFTYVGVGDYLLTQSEAFTADKTYTAITNNRPISTDSLRFANVGTDTCTIKTRVNNVATDAMLTSVAIEIRIYI